MTAQIRNWATNQAFGATVFHRPESVEEVRRIVAAGTKVKTVGARHSFNTIHDTAGDLLSLEKLDRVLSIDAERRTATVEGGIRYAALGVALHEAGFGIFNTASLPQISVAGAAATATHGSGDGNPILGSFISELDLVVADGSIVTLSRERDGDRFLGAVVNLGALGVVTRIVLDLLPTYEVHQTVYEGLTLEGLADNFDAIMGSGYSVSPFTGWGQDTFRVWVKRLVAGDYASAASLDTFGATAAIADRLPVSPTSAKGWTEQRGLPGPWHERLPHFRADGLTDSGAELQSEYFVPREHARAALLAVAELRDRIAPLLVASEIRTIAADRFWMSPFYDNAGVAIHFTWNLDWPGVSAFLPDLEAAIDPFDARPHWGKLFTTPPERIRALFPRRPDFQALAQEFDPTGKFRNTFLDHYVFAD